MNSRMNSIVQSMKSLAPGVSCIQDFYEQQELEEDTHTINQKKLKNHERWFSPSLGSPRIVRNLTISRPWNYRRISPVQSPVGKKFLIARLPIHWPLRTTVKSKKRRFFYPKDKDFVLEVVQGKHKDMDINCPFPLGSFIWLRKINNSYYAIPKKHAQCYFISNIDIVGLANRFWFFYLIRITE